MDLLLRRLPARNQSFAVRYSAAAALALASYVALIGLHNSGEVLGLYLFFPAIFISAALFDHGSGIFATLLSTALVYWRLKPAGALPPNEIVVHLLIFAVLGCGLAIGSEALRVGWERAVTAEREKDLLLHELGHRAMNNLAMVVSILSLQARSVAEPEVRAALQLALTRVRAIVDAHDHFRATPGAGEIEMQPYLEKLGNHIGDALRDLRPIAVEVRADDIRLPTHQAIPLGLIVNELVVNALKHAFPNGRAGIVAVRLRGGPTGSLIVEDNGVGVAPDSQDRMGARLIRLLAEQIRAKLSFEDAQPGRRVRVEFAAEASSESS